MRPIEVSDYELEHGVDSTKYLPLPDYKPLPKWPHNMAKRIVQKGDFDALEFVPRLGIEQNKAERHLRAIKATRSIDVQVKIMAIESLLYLWYHSVQSKQEP